MYSHIVAHKPRRRGLTQSYYKTNSYAAKPTARRAPSSFGALRPEASLSAGRDAAAKKKPGIAPFNEQGNEQTGKQTAIHDGEKNTQNETWFFSHTTSITSPLLRRVQLPTSSTIERDLLSLHDSAKSARVSRVLSKSTWASPSRASTP